MTSGVENKRLAYVAWAAVCLIWGTTYLGIRVSLESMPPALMGGIRLFVWMIGTWLVAARFAYKSFAAPSTRRRPHVTLPTPRIVTPTVPSTRPAFRKGSLTPA